MSDTGSIIVELGGSLDGAGDAAALKRYSGAVRARVPRGGLRRLQAARPHDAGAIEAMGAA